MRILQNIKTNKILNRGFSRNSNKFAVSRRVGGQLIVEAVIAMSFMIIGVLAFFGLMAQSLSYNSYISENYTATFLAAEGVEVVRNMVDFNVAENAQDHSTPWNQGLDTTGCYKVDYSSQHLGAASCATSYTSCSTNSFLVIDDNGFYQYSKLGRTSPFKRCVILHSISHDEIAVNSIVTWQSRGVGHTVNVEDHFFNYRGNTTP